MPAVNDTLGAQVLAQLRQQLVTGRLSPGERLSLRTLGQTLGVSVQPVRHAVAQLVAERALEVTPKRSVLVPFLTEPQFRELTQIRQTLEGFAAEQAALRRGRGELTAMRRHEAAFRRQCQRARPDTDAAIVANAELHFAVYRAAAMPALTAIIEGLWLRIGPALNLDMRAAPQRIAIAPSARCHAQLVAAIEAGDAGAAGAALREDIGSSAAFILERGVLPPR